MVFLREKYQTFFILLGKQSKEKVNKSGVHGASHNRDFPRSQQESITIKSQKYRKAAQVAETDSREKPAIVLTPVGPPPTGHCVHYFHGGALYVYNNTSHLLLPSIAN